MGETKGARAFLSRRKIALSTGVFVALVLFFTVRRRYFYESSSIKPLVSTAKIDAIVNKVADVKSSVWSYVFWRKKKKNNLVDKQRNVWEEWMKMNRHLSPIGDIYDKCDNITRTKIGKVVLEANKDSGGVHVTSYMNCSYDHEIKSSTAHLEVYYKGELLYEKDYDMCKAALKLDTPYSCPIPKGKLLIVRDVASMPSYIPKGTYKITAYVKDQNSNEIGCTYAEFKTGEKKT